MDSGKLESGRKEKEKKEKEEEEGKEKKERGGRGKEGGRKGKKGRRRERRRPRRPSLASQVQDSTMPKISGFWIDHLIGWKMINLPFNNQHILPKGGFKISYLCVRLIIFLITTCVPFFNHT